MRHRTLIPLVVATATLPAAGCSPFGSHPSDDAMIRHFEKHRTEYEELVAMSNHDREMVQIAPAFTYPGSAAGITSGRWERYKRLFRAVDSEGGISRYEAEVPGVVYVSYSDVGVVSRGSSKGYAYSKTPLTPMYGSLDVVPEDLGRDAKAYRRIQGNWYLFFEFE